GTERKSEVWKREIYTWENLRRVLLWKQISVPGRIVLLAICLTLSIIFWENRMRCWMKEAFLDK
ncbi:MAG: hypothetical protein K2K74_12160, partial [Lachnospiraceae bacterium]|nr:hypothetical protein [Lachnospiraceae bacterium]